MTAASEDQEQPRRYAVRFTPRASRELIGAMADLLAKLEWRGESTAAAEEKAQAWYNGARAVAASLSENPGRFAKNEALGRLLKFEVRRVLFERAGPKDPAHPYHLYYRVTEEGDDGPLVRVFHVRLATKKAPTQREARALREEL